MKIFKWEQLPPEMQIEEIRRYYDILKKRKVSLFFKRMFDIVVSFLMIVVFLPLFLILAIAIKIDSHGPVFYRQERVTQYGRRFRIHKFRTMVQNADKNGCLVTVNNDSRITRVGRLIRKCRLDEVSQIIDVFLGDMTFVGTRPEVVKYVNRYESIMMATLLLPAGITSEASILYKDEDKLLDGADNVDDVYVEKILPRKMYYNLRSIEQFSLWSDFKTMFKTVFAVLGKEYERDAIEEDLHGNIVEQVNEGIQV